MNARAYASNALLGVEQLRALELADAEQQRRLAQRVLLGRELDLVDADERSPLLELLVDRLEDAGDDELLLVVAAQMDLERFARLRMADVDIEDVAVRVDRARDVAEVLFLELAEPVLQLDVAGLVVLGPDDRDLAAEDVGQLLPHPVAEVDPIERAQRAG